MARDTWVNGPALLQIARILVAALNGAVVPRLADHFAGNPARCSAGCMDPDSATEPFLGNLAVVRENVMAAAVRAGSSIMAVPPRVTADVLPAIREGRWSLA